MNDSETNNRFADDDPFDDIVSKQDTAAAFTPEDAKSHRGNFIIPFGLPGSGKTTFLAALFKFLNESNGLKSEIQIPQRGNVPNYAGQAMLNEWERVWKTGRFLAATQVGDDGIRELSYLVKPQKGERTHLNFNVIEVSGEELVKVIAEPDRDPRLPNAIEAVFNNKNIKPMILMIVHPNQNRNDELFHNLIVYLRKNISDRVSSIPIAVIIANPKLALSHLQKRRPDMNVHSELTGSICSEYLKVFAPKTHAVFKSWNPKKRAITPLYVGEIETFEDANNMTLERIKVYNDTHVKGIFAWAYSQFTGKRLGPKWWQRWFC